MGIDFSKFSKEMQTRIKTAYNNDKKIDDKEVRELGLTKEEAIALSQMFAGEGEKTIGDKIEIKKKDNDFTYTLTLENPNATEGRLKWKGDSLTKIREVYPDAQTPYYKDGVVIILDKEGNPVKDKNGNEVKVDYIPRQQTFSSELAEMIVLGHKASLLEKLMHQAEIQKELDRLNSLPPSEESYTELMRSIAFEQMNKKEQTEALLKWTGEKFYAAKEQGDISAMKEYLIQGFGLAFQKMDMASIGNTNISVEGFKDFLKTWSGLNLFCEQMDKLVDDGTDNLTRSEKIWEFTKGVGDAVDHFIGTQGVAFMGTLALAGEAAAAGGIGELWAVATQAYFGFEGAGSIIEGVSILSQAETKEEYRMAGDMVGTGAIMVHGAAKSFKGALTGKLQAGLEVKKALKEIKECKSLEELKEIQDNLSDFPYSEQEKQALNIECLKQRNRIYKEEHSQIPFGKMTDAEFEQLKTKISEKAKKLPKNNKSGVVDYYVENATKENIQIIDKMLSHPKSSILFDSYNFALHDLKNINQAKMFEFYIDNFEELRTTQAGLISDIISKTKTPEEYELRIQILKYAMENQSFGNNTWLADIILKSKSIEEAIEIHNYTDKYGITKERRAEESKKWGEEKFTRMIEDFAAAKEQFGLNVDALYNFTDNGYYIKAKSCGGHGKYELTYYFDKTTGELLSFKDKNNTVYNLKENKILTSIPTKIEKAKETTGITDNKLFGNITETTDLEGNWLGSTEFVQSKIKGEFKIYEYEPSGRRFQVGTAEFDKNGGTHVEKHVTSLDGTVTDYVYANDKAGNRYLYYKITDSKGDILYESSKKFKVIDENHFVSTEDGVSFDIQFTDKEVTVTKLDSKGQKTNEKVVYEIKDYTKEDYNRFEKASNKLDIKYGQKIKDKEMTGKDALKMENALDEHTIDRKLLPALKKLSGSEWFALDKNPTETLRLYNEKDNGHSLNGAIEISPDLNKSFSTLEHEIGHEKFNYRDFEHDEKFLELYHQEKALCEKELSEIELEQLDYFFKKMMSFPESETGAEANQITNTINNWRTTGSRSLFVMKYLPRTIAYVSKVNRGDVDVISNRRFIKSETDTPITNNGIFNSSRTLEGGVKDSELTEVAPFAQRLERSITPDDLIPERKMVDLENGDFTPEGKFKSDGTHSVSDAPIADAPYDVVYREKFATYKKMPDGKETIIATTQKGLSKQILNITGGKKVHEGLQNAIDVLIKDGKVTIKDISEVIVNLEYLTNNSSFAKEFLRPWNLEKIQDFQTFKSNLDNYARFKHQMDIAPDTYAQDVTWEVGSKKVKNLLNRSIEFENLIKLGNIKPEEFNKNIDTFYKLGFKLKETVCYDRTSFSDFIFQAHSDKFFERLDYINEFNKKQYTQHQNAYFVDIRTKGGLENDANFEIIKKNIETYQRARQYDRNAANMLINGSTMEADWFEKFEAKFPDKAKREYAYEQYHWLVREGVSSENIQKFADFMNALPEGILESLNALQEYYYGDYNILFANFRNHSERGGGKKDYADELVKRAKILAKCPYLLLDRSSNRINAHRIKEFLCDTKLKDTDKVVEFVENAEPFALAKYRMNTEHQNDKNFAQIMNEANLDLWIENAKLHKEINPKFREYLNSKDALGYKGGFNEKFDYVYDIKTEELKARIDAINKYADKLDNKVLDYIYVGRIPVDTKILDVLTQLEPKVINNFDNIGSFRYVQNLASYSEQGLKNFITFANKYKNRYELIKNIDANGFSEIMNNLTEGELNLLNQHRITDDNSAFKPDTDMIRKRIASIPEKVRKYFIDEKNILTDKYNDEIFDEFGNLTTDNPFKYLDTLSETELKAIGPKAISEFIDNYHKSYGKPVKSFDKARLKVLTELPEALLEKLEGGSKYYMLTGNYPLNTHVITYRYNELVKYGKFEKLDGKVAERICSMPDYSYHLVSEILKAHNDKLTDNDFKDICNNMPISESFEQSEIEYIRKQLINNPKNNPKDIDTELRFLYGKYTTLAENKENLPFQKEVLEDMIERGSKADVKIGQILTRIGNRDIDTAKIVYDCALTCWNDPAVRPANIGELISGIGENNSTFAQKAFHHPKFMGKKDALPEILRELDEYNKNLADYMFIESDKFSVKDGTQILQHTKRYNKEFVERICREGGLTNRAIIKLAEYTTPGKNFVDKSEKLLTSDEMKHWAEENLNNGLDIETITHLGRTQKKLYTEAKQVKDAQDVQAKKDEARRIQMEHVQAEVRADVDALKTITQELVAFDVPEGMAKNAYAKLCVDSNGNIDRMKLDAAKSLIKVYGFYTRVNKKGQTAINPNLTPKDITEIFKLATGDKMSADNGKFRPHVIKDIIALKECGIDDIRFAMNLASIKNMSLVEMKARFKGETRQDIARRIDDITGKADENTLTPNPSPIKGEGNDAKVVQPPIATSDGLRNIPALLKQRGIDLDEIKQKVLTSDKKIEELGNAKIKEGHGTAQIRSLESIVGTERQVLNKFKDQVQPEVWQNSDAFKRWAEEKLADISDWDKHQEYTSKDYAHYNTPRQEGLEKWVEFLKSDESGVKDDVFAQILFLDGITKEMKPDNAYTPPAISREVFEHVYNEILAGNTEVSFTQAYSELNKKKAIEKYGTQTESSDGIKGTWVKIPQSTKGEPLYDEHIAMVQSLAEGSVWCLRFENAHNYLQKGDIHFFVDSKSDSQIAINVKPDGQINDMQRRYKQDGTVPIPYIVPIAKYYKEHNFTGRDKAIKDALDAKPEFDRQKVEFAKMLEEGRVADIFKELGHNNYSNISIEATTAEDGTYILNFYSPLIKGKNYTLFDLGINEDVLFENVSEISETMYLEGSALKTAPKLRKVGHHINFGDNKANDLRALEEIHGRKITWEK